MCKFPSPACPKLLILTLSFFSTSLVNLTNSATLFLGTTTSTSSKSLVDAFIASKKASLAYHIDSCLSSVSDINTSKAPSFKHISATYS